MTIAERSAICLSPGAPVREAQRRAQAETNQRVGGGDGTGGVGGWKETRQDQRKEPRMREKDRRAVETEAARRIPTVLVTSFLYRHFLLLIVLFWSIGTAAPVAPVGSRCSQPSLCGHGSHQEFVSSSLLGFGGGGGVLLLKRAKL